jgi:hypothetical protein
MKAEAGPLGHRKFRRMEVPMEKNKKSVWSGKALRKSAAIAALLLTAVSLSACIVADDRGYRGGWNRHHHWNNAWNGGGPDWQDDGGGHRRH